APETARTSPPSHAPPRLPCTIALYLRAWSRYSNGRKSAQISAQVSEESRMARYQFTSESVTEGHPDKLCDHVSDAILDAILAQDKRARVACETLAKTGMVLVAGEITTTATIDYPTIVRKTVKDIGYVSSEMGFDANTCAVITAVEKQSPDISQG